MKYYSMWHSYSSSFLGKTLSVKIDRPLGSAHPKYNWIYPVNYWYVLGVLAPDWEELDAYMLGVTDPLDTFFGRCIAVIHRIDDDDDKLVVVPEDTTLTDDDIREMTYFQEQYFHSEIIR